MPKLVRNRKKILLTRYKNGMHEYDGARYSQAEELYDDVAFSFADLNGGNLGTPVLTDFMFKFSVDNKLRPGDKLEVILKVVK